MKKRILSLIFGTTFLTGMVVFLTQCESNAEELAQMDAIVNADRGGNLPAAQNQPVCQCINANYPVQPLSPAESDALLFMREEEKLARDVYIAMYAKWNMPVFANIKKAEQRHMDAILCLIQKYNLTDPVRNNPEGVFQNSSLQTLYYKLIDQGNQSLTAALSVGAGIEDADIKDLMDAVAKADNDDVKAVFGELSRASRNHLRAFSNFLEVQGVSYIPASISPELYEQIMSGNHERGTGACFTGYNGGPSNGPGNCNRPCFYGNNGPGNGYGPGNCNPNCPYYSNNGPGNGPGNRNGKGNKRWKRNNN